MSPIRQQQSQNFDMYQCDSLLTLLIRLESNAKYSKQQKMWLEKFTTYIQHGSLLDMP